MTPGFRCPHPRAHIGDLDAKTGFSRPHRRCGRERGSDGTVTFDAEGADVAVVWWVWVLGAVVVWVVAAVAVAVVLGRGIRLADLRSPGTGVTPSRSLAAALANRRRALPLPPVGIALAATAVALETVGYVLRLTGGGPQALSMDAPFALPRMFVAALFAAGALTAVVAAARVPERRVWWLAVALVAGGIAVVKAGGTVHSEALGALSSAIGDRAAVLTSGAAAVAVVAALWFLSRTERRDRRRVLGTLGAYAVASVGLSALSAVAPVGWAATATFVEESGEALAGVAFLVAVLVGAAPRLVLPADWALRRAADARTADVVDLLPGRSAAHDQPR